MGNGVLLFLDLLGLCSFFMGEEVGLRLFHGSCLAFKLAGLSDLRPDSEIAVETACSMMLWTNFSFFLLLWLCGQAMAPTYC